MQGPLDQQMGDLRVDNSFAAGPASLMDADAMPRPSYGPTLGPQEYEVWPLTCPCVLCCVAEASGSC